MKPQDYRPDPAIPPIRWSIQEGQPRVGTLETERRQLPLRVAPEAGIRVAALDPMICSNFLIQFMSDAGGRAKAMLGLGRCKALARREVERDDAVREDILDHLGNGCPRTSRWRFAYGAGMALDIGPTRAREQGELD